jgi:hypothetical protein
VTEIIMRGRQGGKTTELIRRAAETGAYIVCTDRRRAWQIARQAIDAGLAIQFPLTAGEWQERAYSHYPRGMPGLLFDDLDQIIAGMSVVPVLAVTWTTEEAQAPDVGKPVCPQCGTSGCLEDKALDF